jgi:hypothetical protein
VAYVNRQGGKAHENDHQQTDQDHGGSDLIRDSLEMGGCTP